MYNDQCADHISILQNKKELICGHANQFGLNRNVITNFCKQLNRFFLNVNTVPALLLYGKWMNESLSEWVSERATKQCRCTKETESIGTQGDEMQTCNIITTPIYFNIWNEKVGINTQIHTAGFFSSIGWMREKYPESYMQKLCFAKLSTLISLLNLL